MERYRAQDGRRWTIYVKPRPDHFPDLVSLSPLFGGKRVEVVPASQLQGAVEEIERLRAVIRDMKSLMPIVRNHAQQVIEWGNEVLSPPDGGQ